MRIRAAIAGVFLAAATIGGGAVAVAQEGAPNLPSAAGQREPPASISGRVVDVDQKAGRLVIESSDGQRREFKMSPHELANTKVGDQVEATRVSPLK
jgi:hypothetical protein